MANITLPTTLTVGDGATVRRVKGGTAITVGNAVYRDPTTGEYLKAQANADATDDLEGIAVTPSGDGQELLIVTEGPLHNASGLTAGQWYVLSASGAGLLMPVADLVATNRSVLAGYALSATSFYVKIIRTGVAVG